MPSPLSPLAELILARRTAGVKRNARTGSPANERAAGAVPRDALASRIASIAAADPRRRDKARRIFIEFAIADALGQQLGADPGFARLVVQVEEALRLDAATSERLESIVIELLAHV